MLVRFAVYRARRRARYMSKFSPLTILAQVNGLTVGRFRNGRETKGL